MFDPKEDSAILSYILDTRKEFCFSDKSNISFQQVVDFIFKNFLYSRVTFTSKDVSTADEILFTQNRKNCGAPTQLSFTFTSQQLGNKHS